LLIDDGFAKKLDLSIFWIPACEAVSQSLAVIASDRRERGNLFVFNAL
jgi:hypothetical protein